MKPAKFVHHQPATVDETLELLAEYGDDAKILAGGQSLVPLMNFRLTSPDHLIDVNGVAELERRATNGASLQLGALTRVRALETQDDIRSACPLLAQAARYIAHPQIRTRATVGGSLAHADPSAELPGVALALGATMIAVSRRGERRIPASEFFEYHLTTSLEPDELLVAVEVPAVEPRQGSCFVEVAARHGDFAAAGVAAVVALGADQRISAASVVCISVGPTPQRVDAAERLLADASDIDDGLAEAVAAAVMDSVEPTGEHRASANYKRRVSGALARDAVRQALATAGGN